VGYGESNGKGLRHMSSLTKRILTALVFIPIVLWCLWRGGWAFFALTLTVSLVAIFELQEMLDSMKEPVFRPLLYVASVCLLGAIHLHGELWVSPVMCAAFLAVAIGELVSPLAQPFRRGGLMLLSLFYGAFLPSHFLLLRRHPQGLAYVLLVLLGTWAADTGAYFVGMRWGKHKLAPRISPNKSVEGALGGLVAAALVTGYLDSRLQIGLVPGWILGLLIALAAMTGDLFESALKREAGVKDSGWILPGHGGVLDRIDSLLFAAPAIYYLVRWLG